MPVEIQTMYFKGVMIFCVCVHVCAAIKGYKE